MDLYTFNQKEEKERAQLILKQGHLLVFRYEVNQTVALYYMGNFFAEIWYKPNPNLLDLASFFLSHDRIIFVHAFNSQSELDPYLELIILPEI